jgi:hypothetical protein
MTNVKVINEVPSPKSVLVSSLLLTGCDYPRRLQLWPGLKPSFVASPKEFLLPTPTMVVSLQLSQNPGAPIHSPCLTHVDAMGSTLFLSSFAKNVLERKSLKYDLTHSPRSGRQISKYRTNPRDRYFYKHQTFNSHSLETSELPLTIWICWFHFFVLLFSIKYCPSSSEWEASDFAM